MSLSLDKSAWQRVTFGEVVSNVNETVRDARAKGIERVIAMEHLDPGELTIRRWGNLEVGTTFTRRVRAGQTLFGKRRAYQRKAAFADFDAICSSDILVFQADTDRILPEFLPFLVQTEGFYTHALSTSAGSLSPRTNWRDLSGYEFDLPTLEDQRRLANLLLAVERERSAARGLARALDAAEAAWIEQFSTASDRTVRLGDILHVVLDRRGVTPTKLNGEFLGSGVPVISAMNIANGRVVFSAQERYVSEEVARRWMKGPILPGDILMTSEAPLGSTVLVQTEMRVCLGQRLFALRPDAKRVLPEYLYAWLRSRSGQAALQSRASGTTVTGIRQAELVKVQVPLPGLSQQQSFLTTWKHHQTSLHAVHERTTAALRLKEALNRQIGRDA